MVPDLAPPGLPSQVALQLQQLAHATFSHAFVDAMRPTLALPIAVIVAAAVVALAARGRSHAAGEAVPEPEEAVA